MPQVPYSPVPQVAPTGSPLPEVRSNVTAASFGGDVAHAIQGFGREAAGAGNAIYERALWLQGLNNQAEARQAEADYTIEVGKLHAEYAQKAGDEAVKAYPVYSNQLRELRQSFMGRMTTKDSQRLFSDNSIGTMSRAIMNGASHLASQQKAYAENSINAKMAANMQEVSLNPDDDDLYNKKVKENKELAKTLSTYKVGSAPGDAISSVSELEATSATLATRIQSQIQSNSPAARKLYEENKDSLTPTARKKFDAETFDAVRSDFATKGATDYLAANTDDDGNLKVTQKQMYADLDKVAKSLSPDDPKLPSMLKQTAQMELNRTKILRRSEINEANETLFDTMVSGAKSLKEMQISKPLAWEILPSSQKAQWDGRFYRYQQARDRPYNDEVMTRLRGMADNAPHELIVFDQTKLEHQLSQPNQKEVLRMQQKARREEGKAPQTERFMAILQSAYSVQLGELNLHSRGPEHSTQSVRYDELTGKIVAAVDNWRADHNNKNPTQMEFREKIAPDLMKYTIQKSPFGSFFDTKKYYFEADKTTPINVRNTSGALTQQTYKEFVKQTSKAMLDSGAEPDQWEIDRLWTRLQLKSLGEKRVKEGGSK